MKKLITILIGILFAIALQGQGKNDFKYVINALGGTVIGPTATLNKATISSGILDGNLIKIYDGATQRSFDVAPADQVEGVALADSTGNAVGNYVPRESIKKMIVDEYGTGNALMRAMNYLAGSKVIKAVPVLGSVMFDAGSTVITDTRMIGTLMEVTDTCTVTGIGWVSGAATGDYTPDAENGIALYSISGGVATFIAEKLSSTAWSVTAYAKGSLAFEGGPITITAGYYYAVLLYNSSAVTIAPTIYFNTGSNLHTTMGGAEASFTFYKDAISEFPDTIDISTMSVASLNTPGLWLY